MHAQLETAAAQRRDARAREQRMRVVGVVGMHHPLVLTVAQDGQIGIDIDDRQTEDVARNAAARAVSLTSMLTPRPRSDRP